MSNVGLAIDTVHGNHIDRYLSDLDDNGELDEGEVFILKHTLTSTNGNEMVLMLTNTHYHEFPAGDHKLGNQRKRKRFTDIHSVIVSPDNPRVFTINWFSGHTSVKSKAKAGFLSMKQALKIGTDWADFIKPKSYIANNPTERFEFVFVLQRLLRDLWQKTFEERILRSPEVYQRHEFVVKGKHNRVLLLSHRWLYNLEVSYHPTTLGELKWARPIDSIKCVSFIPDRPELILSFQESKAQEVHHFGSKKAANFEKAQQWTMISIKARNNMIIKFRQLYLQLTGEQLMIKAPDGSFVGVQQLNQIGIGTVGVAVPPTLQVNIASPSSASSAVSPASSASSASALSPLSSAASPLSSPSTPPSPSSKNSVDSAPTVVLETKLMKTTTSVFGRKVWRNCQLYSDGSIRWTDEHKEMIIAINPSEEAMKESYKKLDSSQRDCFFHLSTTGKTLTLIAENERVKNQWVDTVKRLLQAKEEQRKSRILTGPVLARTASTITPVSSSNTASSSPPGSPNSKSKARPGLFRAMTMR